MFRWVRRDLLGERKADMADFVSTPRGRFAVQVSGPAAGPPVVLVAGLGDDHASWDPVLGYLTS